MNRDVIVVGTGNAALCAALSAAEQGASVVVLEKAPRAERGGNSRFTDGAIRFAYDGLGDLRTVIPAMTDEEASRLEFPGYPANAYVDDLERMSEGLADPSLVRELAERSYDTIRWMSGHGVRFEPIYDNQAFEMDGRLQFWGGLVVRTVGRGIGLTDRLFDRATELGVDVRYDAGVVGLIESQGRIAGVWVGTPDGRRQVLARSVVLACGGFEANQGWRARHLGTEWERCVVRGTPHNTGDGLAAALDVGAQPWGDWTGCHAVAMDVGAPATGDFATLGDVFKKHSYPLGVIVNRDGNRFVDEGADFRNYTYARYGKELLAQPDGVAYHIFDDQVSGLLRSEYKGRDTTRLEADTLPGLARQLDVDSSVFLATIRAYNRAVQEGDFRPHVLDGKCTEGVSPPKSNWALRIEKAPFLAFPVRCGITFTFGGIRIDTQARVLGEGGEPLPSLFAAGEMVGGLFHHNYPGGAGLMSGAVFGRIAGAAAAREATSQRTAPRP